MAPEALKLHARSVDHLEAANKADLLALAASDTFGVMLPATSFHAGTRYARAGAFVDSGGLLALATNYNPGTAPSHSMPLAIALAVRYCGLTPAEAIAAATVNAAAVLGLADRGTIEAGQRADLILLRHHDERLLLAPRIRVSDPIEARDLRRKTRRARRTSRRRRTQGAVVNQPSGTRRIRKRSRPLG